MKPGTASRAERAIFWHGAKPFLHPIACFDAHLIIEFPLMEFQNLHPGPALASAILHSRTHVATRTAIMHHLSARRACCSAQPRLAPGTRRVLRAGCHAPARVARTS